MDADRFLLFCVATIAMIALPGPSVLLTVAHSVSYGWRRALLTVAGATAGIAAQLLISIVGIAALVRYAAAFFALARWVGAAYLVAIGIRTWMRAGDGISVRGEESRGGKLFAQGLVITVFNPKSLLFMAAFLPQFLDARHPLGLQFAIIVPTFLAITFLVTSLWAVLSGAAANSAAVRFDSKVLFRATSVLIVITGLGMAFASG